MPARRRRPRRHPSERHLTDIDWALAKDLIDAVVGGLSTSWTELQGPELVRGELDLEGDGGVAALAGEPTLSVRLASKIDGVSSSISLLMPWAAVEPIAERVRAHGTPAGRRRRAPPTACAAVWPSRRCCCGRRSDSSQMPIERMLGIVPGALVELVRAGRGRRDPVRRGSLGRTGEAGAQQDPQGDQARGDVTRTPTRAATYAKLGRAELERARAHVEAIAGEESPGILRNIFVRVWAELGRTHMSLGAGARADHGCCRRARPGRR